MEIGICIGAGRPGWRLQNPEADIRSPASKSPTDLANDIYRIGGGSIENLRLKPAEVGLNPPGISVFKGGSPADAAGRMKAAFPNATKLHESAKIVGSSTVVAIQCAGFDIRPDPTKKFPDHHRITHPEGAAGFVDENLARLSEAFTDVVPGD